MVQPNNKIIVNKNNRFLPPKNRMKRDENVLLGTHSTGKGLLLFVSFSVSKKPPR